MIWPNFPEMDVLPLVIGCRDLNVGLLLMTAERLDALIENEAHVEGPVDGRLVVI